jgi:hypothetical protein
VPSGLSLEETSATRVGYFASRGYASPIKLIHDFQRRDATLRKAREFDEAVLWFEHDLYDQLQLLQTLTVLEELDLEPGRVATVQSDSFLASMTVEEIVPLLHRRRTATAAIFKSARRNWERFTSQSPRDLYAATGEETIGLPFLRAALRRLCEEYPWTRDGLSRSQRHALHAVAQGAAREQELFARSQAREEASFLGTREFAAILADLGQDPGALIESDGSALTPLGRRVLAGDADWLEEHPVDRWIGGVHLESGECARWDEDTAQLV